MIVTYTHSEWGEGHTAHIDVRYLDMIEDVSIRNASFAELSVVDGLEHAARMYGRVERVKDETSHPVIPHDEAMHLVAC